MKIEFQSRRQTHRTLFLFVAHRPDEIEVFRDLEHALVLIHWVRDQWEAPALRDGTTESHFFRTGTGIFGEWTDRERVVFETAARNALMRFVSGKRVPHRKLRMQDCV